MAKKKKPDPIDNCPSCGSKYPLDAVECPTCGLIFSKWIKREKKQSVENLSASRRETEIFVLVVKIFIVVILLSGSWFVASRFQKKEKPPPPPPKKQASVKPPAPVKPAPKPKPRKKTTQEILADLDIEIGKMTKQEIHQNLVQWQDLAGGLETYQGFHQAVKDKDYRALKLYIKNEVDVNYLSKYRETALSMASRLGHIECARLLLKAGAKPEIETLFTPTKNVYQAVAIYEAAENGRIDLVKLLLKFGAIKDAKLQNLIKKNSGKTALEIAQEKGLTSIVKLLEAS